MNDLSENANNALSDVNPSDVATAGKALVSLITAIGRIWRDAKK